jgi:hypothetical protein
MKTKLLALVATLGMVASASAVKINNNLSINGFIDGSYENVNGGTAASERQSLEVDEVELNFIANVGNVSGFISYDSHFGGANHAGVSLEQAHISYNINDSVSISFGRYGRSLGLEGEDPAGLYTYSRAYSDGYNAEGENQGSAFNFANIDGVPGSVDGVTITYSADAYSLAISLENTSAEAGTLNSDDLDAEISFSYNGLQNTVIGGGYLIDNEQAGVQSETNAMNIFVTRQFGKLLVGAEYSELDTDHNGEAGASDDDRDAYLVLLDYDYSDKLGVALRLSSTEKAANGGDVDRFTIAPNYAITESLGAILEYSDIDDAGRDIEEYAVELTYTF